MNIKFAVIALFVTLNSIVSYAQNVVLTQNYAVHNNQTQLYIRYSNTHFKIDTPLVYFNNSLTNPSDSIPATVTWLYEYGFYVNVRFNEYETYDLNVANTMDGTFIQSNAITVCKNYIYKNELFELNASDTAVVINIDYLNTYNVHLQSSSNLQVSLVNDKSEIIPDSVEILSETAMKLHFNSFAQNAAGFYNLLFNNSIDSLTFDPDFVFIHNYDQIQIDSISPDSFDNITWNPNNPNPLQTIFKIYGHNTHFTDSNTFIFFSPEPFGITDSILIENDSLITLYYTVYMACKQDINSIKLIINNHIDGTLEYPLIFVFYGSTPEHESFKNLSAFPNPTSGTLTIKADDFIETEEIVVSVFEVSGRKIWSKNYAKSTDIQLDLSQHPQGNYIIRIESKTKTQYIKCVKI